jgi:RNA polymerase sigma-70 factor (ECF subfamily)
MNRAQATQLIDGLFDTWYPTLMRYACRLSGSVELAEDMAQETFLCLYRELAGGKTIEHPKAWCLCVLRREWMRHRQQCARQHTSQFPDDLEGLASGRVEPEYAQFLFQDVLRFFDRLSEREEQVLLLRMESMKYCEIAEHLGITSNSVSTLLARALRKLQTAVGPQGDVERARITAEEIQFATSR